MATVKIKFRPSTVPGGKGSIFYQVIHHRVARQQSTGYRLYTEEWNDYSSEVVIPEFGETRKCELLAISHKIQVDMRSFQRVICGFEQSGRAYTANDVVAAFATNNAAKYLFSFMEEVILQLKLWGRVRTSETYATTLRSFKRFRENRDVLLEEISADLMMGYESYLRTRGVRPNSSSFYMRNLRAVYNRAVEQGLTTQKYPFKHVYTGVDKTIKRAVSLRVIKRIKELYLAAHPMLDFARDMFLFSFYTRGMSFVDMAYLRKKDLAHGVLSYRRRKTGQQLLIRWERCMQEIVDKYDTSSSPYLLPIINPFSEIEERQQYIYMAHNINHRLRKIGSELGLTLSLTLYVARHAWASIAKSKNVPISIISEGMGHDSDRTTRIYLTSLDTDAIDKANRMILKSLQTQAG